MTEETIRIVLDKDEAERRLDDLDGKLEDVREEADKLDDATRSGKRKGAVKRSGGSSGGGFGGAAAKGAAIAAGAVVATQVAEVVSGVIGQKFDELGLTSIGGVLRGLSEKITGVTSIAAQIQGLLGAAQNVANPFLLSGLESEGVQAGFAAAPIGRKRALEEQRQARREGQSLIKSYGKIGGDTLSRVARGGL
tara:strand:- start:11652 stop:12233 length:582 start_codon:yes stop_codon:yes gene_type:complete